MPFQDPKAGIERHLEAGNTSPWPSFESFEELARDYGSSDGSYRRMNLGTLTGDFPSELERFRDPGNQYEIGVFDSVARVPSGSVDLSDLDTDISLAVIRSPKKESIVQDISDNSKVVVRGQDYHLKPLDEEGAKYLKDLT